MKRITTAIIAAFALPLAGGCEYEDRADEVGEAAEEVQEQRLEEGDVYGEVDQEISGEITEERFELIEETRQDSVEARAEEDDILQAKPE